MKRFLAVLLALCVLATGCSNEFAVEQYDISEKIAQSDQYAKSMSVHNSDGSGFDFSAGSFDGRETLWTEYADEAKSIAVEISFSLSEGKAKLVHIDSSGNVTTLIECEPETSADGARTMTIALKEGSNRFKLVGYGCKELDVKFDYKADVQTMKR